jgi:hypothetical protein
MPNSDETSSSNVHAISFHSKVVIVGKDQSNQYHIHPYELTDVDIASVSQKSKWIYISWTGMQSKERRILLRLLKWLGMLM